jgi:uncharacterized cofD-like protein
VDSNWDPAALDSGTARLTGVMLGIFGLTLTTLGIVKLVHSLSTAMNPTGSTGSLVDVVYRNRYLSQGPRVVVIGGGTGLSTMLRGLKQHTSNITAVVTVADDGGSSGKLQKQLNILPPGDIRNCLVSLADAEATMTDLFQYRFRGNGASEGLRDHNFGNLLIAAVSEISGGDFKQAVRLTSRVLNIRGEVLPSTLCRVTLRGEMEDGSFIMGETNITHSNLRVRKIELCPDDAQPLDEVLDAIDRAEIIVVGPGSVFTSIIPNLLVAGIPAALNASRARKVYVCNVMTQPGETDGFSASDHIRAIDAHVPRPIVDYVMINTEIPSLDLVSKYRQAGSVIVEPDSDRIRKMGYRPIAGNFINQTDVVRHDATRLSEAIMRLL